MCGIFGLIGWPNRSEAVERVSRAMDTMVHRGPDGDGLYVHEEDGVVFGHRRLAIIDPANGKQPMTTPDARFTVVFNGAIYNYLELRRELVAKGHAIVSYSDTEVLLAAYREWGERCVDRFQGMFAFAIWDFSLREIFCARDRVGIKPFYYIDSDEFFSFSSEIKAFVGAGLLDVSLNQSALKDYLAFQFCLGEKTLFSGVKKLEPGFCLKISVRNGRRVAVKRQYWDVTYDVDRNHDESWFVDQLAALIEDSTRMHIRSDVPLGAHLSGGLDSSTVVCLVAKMLQGEGLHTFTGTFPDGPQYDETEHAKAVSAFASTNYHEISIQGADFSTLFPKLMYFMDEPAAGPGLIPQYHVSKLASQQVKVVLGGQGGDELFIGYARYLVAYLEACLQGAIDESFRDGPYAVTLESIVPNLPVLKAYKPMLRKNWSQGLFGPAAERYFQLIDRAEESVAFYSADVLDGPYSAFTEFDAIFNRPGVDSLINKMTYFDLKASLPALLHVEDRTSMSASIESRVPLLDHRIVEFMAKIPPNKKFAGGRLKHLFKSATRNIVPQSIMQRKDKMGFPTPLNNWTQGVAKEYVDDLIFSRKTRERGIFDVDQIATGQAKQGEYGRALWGMMCLEQWHRSFKDGDAFR